MKKTFIYFYAIALTSLLFACGGGTEKTGEEGSNKPDEMPKEELLADNTLMKDSIKIYPMPVSPEYPDAKLTLKSPAADSKVVAGEISFDYDVASDTYKLGNQTADAETKNCANSGKGQHIHLILNNEPYSAHYESSFSKELADGHYVALSFLSRSYHESIKTTDAYQLFQFTVGDAEPKTADLSASHVVYSRPKGEYTGDDTKKVMLDFYVLNTELSETGNRIKATINGKTEFMIAKWQPYFMEGLPMGENTIKLELVDKDGNLVEGGMNTVERKFMLSDLQ